MAAAAASASASAATIAPTAEVVATGGKGLCGLAFDGEGRLFACGAHGAWRARGRGRAAEHTSFSLR